MEGEARKRSLACNRVGELAPQVRTAEGCLPGTTLGHSSPLLTGTERTLAPRVSAPLLPSHPQPGLPSLENQALDPLPDPGLLLLPGAGHSLRLNSEDPGLLCICSRGPQLFKPRIGMQGLTAGQNVQSQNHPANPSQTSPHKYIYF